MYTTKEKRLINKFSKENDLIYPNHTSDYDNPVRKDFITDLLNNEKFVPAKNNAEERYKTPVLEFVKNFKVKDYVSAVLLTTMLSSVYYGLFSDSLFKHKGATTKNQKIAMNLVDAASVLLFVLSAMLLNSLFLGSFKQTNQEVAVDNLYKRLSVRLFVEIKKIYPSLNEEVLKQCNPELARVIYTLLISNMPEKDTRKLWQIANSISEHKYNKMYKGEIGDLKIRDKALQQAMTIVESWLIDNPELVRVITDVYRGNVPATFVIKEQNTK
ncbi:MAG: hypothetical protein IKN73_00050 [Alphaproteobacteria bacterium]|nr:hypothetical protein [Alphaproteobacteria bacterium]